MPTPLATPRRREPPQPAGAKPCRARSLPVWRSPIRADLGLERETHPTPPGVAVPLAGLEVPIRADLGLASPSSPNEFDFAKKGSPE
uniref:Uncharacterized protein n=1 Tax=Fagus sylvatica TaxID=28930 RepID=A0A2N9IRM7_FAGSY